MYHHSFTQIIILCYRVILVPGESPAVLSVSLAQQPEQRYQQLGLRDDNTAMIPAISNA